MARSLAAVLLLLVSAVAVSASQDADSVGSVFFLEKDLHPGSKMTLHFTRATAGAARLQRGRADAIPFASSKLPEILSLLSVPAGSPAAADMSATLAECEAAPLAGEAKLCATSVESMADFAAASLGSRNVRAVSTKISSGTPRQAYAVEAVRPLSVAGGDMVACHGMPYAYAVFGCHTTTAAAYTVTLAGTDGSRAEALAACHADAAPGVAEAYKKLGLKPGSVPVCHFLPQDDTLWVRN